jgi:hypothetical protein
MPVRHIPVPGIGGRGGFKHKLSLTVKNCKPEIKRIDPGAYRHECPVFLNWAVEGLKALGVNTADGNMLTETKNVSKAAKGRFSN